VEEIAFRTNLSRSTISIVRNGEVKLRASTVETLSKALKLDVKAFYTVIDTGDSQDDSREVFVRNAQALMASCRLSHDDLGFLSGVSRQHIRELFTFKQKSYPRLDTMQKIARGLKCPLFRLLDPDFTLPA
jgi:transcriptional regulator with XRE-family HTH domain